MTAVVSAISDVVSVVGEVFTVMTSNALLTFFLAGSVLGVGVAIFRKIRGAAK
jgi:hypothetical protein